ncbi:hypothetical protein ACSLBF_21335 (plasmid) [Pseudoalteromonas sp. T1lg65]|uniref:hypothetical protein n=1 Tax=Pseudoalteromonas sp. T1lg65 TaxID=2077101 RepID=UPI003F78E548
MKTVYLHIGNFKTATTTLQIICDEHKQQLDFLYPNTGKNLYNTCHSDLALALIDEHGVTPPWWYNGKKPDGSAISFEQECMQLRNEIDTSPHQRVLISSEDFSRVGTIKYCAKDALTALAKQLSDYQIKVIFYIREPLSFLKSWYCQRNIGEVVTMNFIRFFNDVDSSLLGQYQIYALYAEAFGANNVTVKTFHKKGNEHINDFFQAIDSQFRVDDQTGSFNTALDDLSVELRRLSKFVGTVEDAITSKGVHPLFLTHKVAHINEQFSQVTQLADYPITSQLSVESLFQTYIEKLKHIPGMITKELDYLSMFANYYESSAPKTCDLLRSICNELTPETSILDRYREQHGAIPSFTATGVYSLPESINTESFNR